MSESENRARIVIAARRWLGTPYLHGQRTLGVGVDCVGLINGVGIETDLMDYTEDAWAPFKGYGQRPNVRVMRKYMTTFHRPSSVDRKAIPPIGSIGWFAWRENLPMHLGVVAEHKGRPTIIHANNLISVCSEHGLDAHWPGMVDSWWDFAGVRG